jgi:hypothetical protein
VINEMETWQLLNSIGNAMVLRMQCKALES